ncbi:MAG: MOSC domain-containing protein [Chloroflexota bacterium]|nr:MOSC domain-containing protein [Chloroflexota bacterium]
MSSPASAGRVVAVCSSPRGGVPKQPQKQIVVGPQGVEGDWHAGPVNKHKKTGDPEPNWRQLTVVGIEALEAMNAALGAHLGPGDLAENVLLSGHGALSDLAEGDRIVLGAQVVLKVSKQNRPCSTLDVYDVRLVKELLGRRGVACVVETTGVVKPGDPSEIVRARQAT